MKHYQTDCELSHLLFVNTNYHVPFPSTCDKNKYKHVHLAFIIRNIKLFIPCQINTWKYCIQSSKFYSTRL